MPTQFTYSYARQHLAQILRDSSDSQEPAVITRRGQEDMVLLPAAEYRSMMETLHLVRSPKNGLRLFKALDRALSDKGTPRSLEELKAEFGLE